MSASPDPQPILNHFLSQFVPAVGVKAVFGEPIMLPYATVVPVARVAWGLGAGFGGGQRAQATNDAEAAGGSGGGYGGGAVAYPVGVLDIRPKRTSFVRPPGSTRHVLLGIAVGAALTYFLQRRKS